MQPEKFEFHQLLHSADLVEAQLRSRLSLLGIRPRQARILDALSRMKSVTQNDLARAFDITPASMSTMTVRLVSAGLISRKPDPEETRCNLLQLTDQGQALLHEIHVVWREMDRFIEGLLGAEDTQILARVTRNLRDKLGGKVPGSPLGN